MKLGTLPKKYVSSRTGDEVLKDTDIFPFDTFCRRGNYCPRCNYDCRQREHIKRTRELWESERMLK